MDSIFNYTHISTNTTTNIKNGGGLLHSVVVNTTAAGTITIYDGAPVAANAIAIIKASVLEGTYLYDLAFKNGLTVVTAGASDLTVTWG